jgi:carbamoyltransferase
MVVIGIHIEHDASIAIIKDGRIIFNLALEKYTRIKKDYNFNSEFVSFALKQAGLTIKDVNFVAINSFHGGHGVKAFTKNNNRVASSLVARDYSRTLNFDNEIIGNSYHIMYPHLIDYRIEPEQLSKVDVNVEICNHQIPGCFVNHHLAHAANVFFLSPFKKAAIFSLDASSSSGILPEQSSLFAYGVNNTIEKLYSPGCMVGTMYDRRCKDLGIGSGFFKAGSLMGLAAYGKVLPIVLEFEEEFTASFWERKRAQRSDAEHLDWQWLILSGQKQSFDKNSASTVRAMNIAASTQYIYEKTVEKFTTQLYEDTKHLDLDGVCFTGGSFLNCAFNGKLRAKKQFKDYFWFPSCGDDGAALGAALYAYHNVLQNPRIYRARKDIMYLGPDWKENEKEYTYNFSTSVEIKDLDYKLVADYIDQGKIIAWFNGRSEVGPRALGNRSFLASPKFSWMRDYINKKVKNREWYRPFAPAVLNDFKKDWFEIDYESPFMLEAVQVRDDKKHLIPAVIHVDNTARVQTLKEEDNPKLFKLLHAHQELTGIPVLLNTSLNLGGEPLIETPEDAFNLFERSNVDILVLGKKIYIKTEKKA